MLDYPGVGIMIRQRKKGGPAARTAEPPFLTLSARNLDQLKVYGAIAFPSTPAENESQPNPPHAPKGPLVGSKNKRK